MNTNNQTNRKLFLEALLLLAFMIISGTAAGQNEYQQFYSKSIKIQNTGMMVLGGWAIANISTGAYGWANNSGENKYFHQMNLFWNAVNISIAGFALYNNSRIDLAGLAPEEMMNEHLQTEKILLINSFLDIGYIGGGFLLKHFGSKSEKRAALLKGYGNSLILQGGFLLVFDLILYGVLKSHRNSFINSINVSYSADMFELQFGMAF